MRIAFITPGAVEHEDYKSGDMLGTEYQVFGLSKELVRRGHEVYIVRRWYDGEKNEEIQGIKVINVASPTLPNSTIGKAMNRVLFSKYARKEITQIKPDILNLTGKYSSYCVCKLDIPTVHVTHIIPMDLLPKDVVPFRGIFGSLHPTKWLESRIYSNCDVVVALNGEHKQYLHNRGFKTIFIPNGVDIEKYAPNYSDEGYIFFAGRLIKLKGLQYLIKAYSMLSSELKDDFKLVIGGFGAEKENLEKLASVYEIKDRVVFIPWLSNLDFIRKISDCTLYVLPSLYETFGIVIIEAMASGKPVIASDIPGPKDIITHGKDGFLFDTGNVSELNRYLEILLDDERLRKSIGTSARKKVEENYTFEKVADKYIDIFNRLLDE